MPSPPTLFDDEGEDRGDDRSRDGDDGETRDHATTPDGGGEAAGSSRRRRRTTTSRGPNYLIRRAVAVGGVVAVLAAAGLVVANLVDDGSSGSSGGSASVDWNRVVTVDARTGALIVADDAGEQQTRLDSGLGDVTDLAIVEATAVVTADGDAIVLDLTAPDEDTEPEPVTVGATGVARPSGSSRTLLAPDSAASRGLIVHGPSGDRRDTDAFAPVAGARYEFGTARSDPSGRHVLVTDSGNFQSVLFSFDRDEPSYFPGLALAVDDRSVVTAQNVGDAATVSVFDHGGEPVASARTPSVRAAILDGDIVRLVTVDGRIVDLDADSGDTTDRDELDIGTVTEGHVGTSGDRLVVVGTDGSAVVGADGTVVATYPGLLPRETATPSPSLGTRCLSLGDPSGDGLVVIDTDDGDVVAEGRSPDLVHPSADGCTVVAPAAGGVDVLDADGVRQVDVDGTLVAVTPDATGIVVDLDGRHVLEPLDGPDPADGDEGDGGDDVAEDADGADAPGVDLGPNGRLVAFTEL